MIRRAVLASVALLAVAGCGAASPSIGSFRSQVTRVCTRTFRQEARIAPPPAPAQTSAFLRRGIAVLRGEIAGLRALRIPKTQAGAYSVALGSLAHEIAILTSTAHDLDRGTDSLTTIKTLQHRLAPVETDVDAAWRTLGVPACAAR
jgi:hypothetical protein